MSADTSELGQSSAGDSDTAARVDDETDARQAFRVVRASLRSHGGYRFMPAAVFEAFDDRTRAAVIAAGGLQVMQSEGEAYDRVFRRFARAYGSNVHKYRGVTAPTSGRERALPPGDR